MDSTGLHVFSTELEWSYNWPVIGPGLSHGLRPGTGPLHLHLRMVRERDGRDSEGRSPGPLTRGPACTHTHCHANAVHRHARELHCHIQQRQASGMGVIARCSPVRTVYKYLTFLSVKQKDHSIYKYLTFVGQTRRSSNPMIRALLC